jgi:hypothetical protein
MLKSPKQCRSVPVLYGKFIYVTTYCRLCVAVLTPPHARFFAQCYAMDSLVGTILGSFCRILITGPRMRESFAGVFTTFLYEPLSFRLTWLTLGGGFTSFLGDESRRLSRKRAFSSTLYNAVLVLLGYIEVVSTRSSRWASRYRAPFNVSPRRSRFVSFLCIALTVGTVAWASAAERNPLGRAFLFSMSVLLLISVQPTAIPE